MRTVHEIEVGKPQEPAPKVQNVQDHKSKRRRSPSFMENGQVDDDIDARSEVDDPELALYSATNRYRYLKRKLRWAMERNASLKEELQTAEEKRWKSWAEKERVLDQLFSREGIHLAPRAEENAALSNNA